MSKTINQKASNNNNTRAQDESDGEGGVDEQRGEQHKPLASQTEASQHSLSRPVAKRVQGVQRPSPERVKLLPRKCSNIII